MSHLHLTQYCQGKTYVKSQIFDLAEKMGVQVKEQGELKPNHHRLYVSDGVVGFDFILTELDSRKDHDAHYYRLAVKNQFLGAIVGARVVLSCHGINGTYMQGTEVTLTRNEGASGWWAMFENGYEWNVGSGQDFIVLSSGLANVEVSETASANINAMSPSVKKQFDTAVAKFQSKLNSKETLHITQWMDGIIYFQVNNPSKGEYPNNIRFLSSFNCESGEFYTGRYKHAVVRNGWGKFAENLLGKK